MDNWIAAGAAVASFLFAVVSWWGSAGSKKARRAAEATADRALRQTEAAEASAAELKKLVDGLSLPPLVASAGGRRQVFVRNTTAAPVEVLEVLNIKAFAIIDPNVTFPVTIPPGAQQEMTPRVLSDSNFHLRVRGEFGQRDVHVPLPGGY